MDAQNNARNYWNRHAVDYDRSMLFFGGPLDKAVARAVRTIDGRRDVLEIAAGTGLFTRALAPAVGRLTVTDYAASMLAVLTERLEAEGVGVAEIRQADLYALPFTPGRFDGLIAANVLHLVPDLAGALAAFHRAVAPGGLVLVPTYLHGETTVSRAVSRLLASTGFPGERRLTRASLDDAVRAAGFELVESTTLPGLLPIGFVAARKPGQAPQQSQPAHGP
jgi:phosphatidylethanolamine/phosphatidyl-N-methylethanolamine N-methyltransferase